MPQKQVLPYQNFIVTPIFRGVSYQYNNKQEVIDYHEGRLKAGRYARYDNPNWLAVEQRLAQLDHAESALIFPSGMSAITTVLLAVLGGNKRLAYTGMGYRNISVLCGEVLPRFGVDTVAVDTSDANLFGQELRQLAARGIDAIFIEAPSNPTLFLADLDMVRNIVGPETLIIVDSSLASPYNFQPLLWGADLVLHSASKYLGGHGDLLAGSVAGTHELIERIRILRNVTGAICDPQAAYLLNRSLDSFAMRMKVMNENGMELATFLDQHPKIRKVYYTGLPSHPQGDLVRKYLKGHGGVVSFEVDAAEEDVAAFVERLSLPFMGTHFGSSQSMVEQPWVFTYYKRTEAERAKLGISNQLVRYSLGFEDIGDVIKDIESALSEVPANSEGTADREPLRAVNG